MAQYDIMGTVENSGSSYDENVLNSTSAEIDTGTADGKVITPLDLAGSVRGRQIFVQSATPTTMATGDIWFDTT